MAGTVIIPWYATGFRADGFETDLVEIAAVALRYGATSYAVYRSRDDRYRITQMAWFENRDDWYRYWEGPEMTEFRARNSGRYQIPIVYVWHDELAAGSLGPEVPTAPEPEPSPEPVPPASV